MSSEIEYDSDSSSSSDGSLSITNKILSIRTQNLVELVSTHVPISISKILMEKKQPHGGSVPGRRFIKRDRHERHVLIMNDYFKGENSKYTAEQFRRRFRMDVELFNRILEAIGGYDKYFTPKIDAVGNCGLSPLQKMVAALRMLAYGCAADLLDEYVQIGESTAIQSLERFCDAVINIFEEEYLRKPNERDVKMLLDEGEKRGFPGMLGSLDCMHWAWKNCPTAWHGTHVNVFKKQPTLILEVVASKSLWIWHAFFGMAGTNNDLNVLNRSPLFDDIINDTAPSCNYVVNGHPYKMGYYLSDGIYPQYATLIQSITAPSTNEEKHFAKSQEAVRKDVERAFGVLQNRWHIVKGSARMWKVQYLGKIMKTCIILHNMIIESERRQGIDPEDWVPHADEKIEKVNLQRNHTVLVSRMISQLKEVQSSNLHKQLKGDLIQHLWHRNGGEAV
ncbi:hypothetical protein OROMI_018738 [Orobanche minor]